MNYSVYDLKNFYREKSGALVRRILSRHIRDVWPDVRGMRLMGCGYALPYLRPYMQEAERSFAVMPGSIGVHFWPEGERGLTCVSGETEFPVETESVDRILVVHGFEYAAQPGAYLHEIWRVLKSNGRLLMVVPNRLGLWARAEWTPFGHGTPYSPGQIAGLLRDNLLVHERTERGLYMPPFRSPLLLRTAYRIENVGRYVMPGLAGVYLVEASKQVYSGIPVKAPVRGEKRILVTGAVPT